MRKSSLLVLIITIFAGLNTVNAQDKNIDQVVAVVGSNIILKSDIEYMNLQNQAQGVTSEGDMKCEILENLLIEKLMVAEAELDTNIVVTDNQINQSLDQRIAYYVQNLGSEKAVEDYFKKPIVELKADMKDMIKNQLLSESMQSTIIANATVTPSEVRYFYKDLANDEKPQMNTEYEYAKITIVPRVEEEEENRIKETLRDYKKRIEAGENFSMFAILYSEGPSATDGGDLGYFGRATMDPAFSAAAFNLKPGQVSNVVKTEFGYHLIQMVDRKGDKVRCKHIILRPKIKTEEIEHANKALDSLKIAINDKEISFEEAALRFSMDKDSRNNGGLVLNPATLSSKFEAEMLPPAVSKVLTTLEVGEISEPFISINDKTKKQEIQIVKLIKKIDSHTANLTDDYQMISDIFLAHKKQQLIEDWIGERQQKTYIRIDPTYMNCEFRFNNWIK